MDYQTGRTWTNTQGIVYKNTQPAICPKCGKPTWHLGDPIDPDCLCQCYKDKGYTINICRQGWTCPKCGRVYGPHIDECLLCNGPKITITLGGE